MNRLVAGGALAALLASAACGGARSTNAPATAGPAGAAAGGDPAVAAPDVAPYTAADVRFMQGMIHHHAQALHMSAMAPTHGASPRVLQAARRIAISQADEISMMERWLRQRGHEVPEPEHAGHHATMPGMLSAEQMAELDAARDSTFDRLFLTYMIQHHEGALVMVDELFAAGAGQDSEIFLFASDVDADQRAEIARMREMLNSLTGERRG